MKYAMRGKVRASHSVALSYKHVKGLYSTLVTVFSFLFIVLCVFSSAAVIDYSVRNESVVGIANAQDSIELDEDVYDESEDAEKQAEEARKKRQEDAEAARESSKRGA